MSKVQWIKLNVDIFDNAKIKYIRKMPDGDKMLLIWIAVLTMAGRCNSGGMLILADTIPYSPKMIADEYGFEENTVQLALNLFVRLNMVSVGDDGTLMIPGWSEYQSADRLEAMRERDRLRKKKEREELKYLEESPRTFHGNSTDSPRTPLTLISDSNSISSSSKSLSFKDTHSNIQNLKYILTLTDKECVRKVNENPELLALVEEWMAYKDEKKPRSANHYDSERGMVTLLGKFVENTANFGIDAVREVVQTSIASNYMGIVWDKIAERLRKPVDKKPADNGFDWEKWMNEEG